MTENYADIRDAKFISLSMIPVTEVANQFCQLVADKLVSQESRKRARKAKDQATFEYAIKLIMGDLLLARKADNAGWVYRSVRKKNFHDSKIKGDTFNAIMKGLDALKYVQTIKGANRTNYFATETSHKFNPGLATRFRATDNLFDLWKGTGLEVSVLGKHFKTKPSLREIRVKSTSSRFQSQKIKGQNLKFKQTDITLAIKSRLFEINRYLIGQNFDGMEFYGLRRVFNEGDSPSFNWNLGGRLYGIGEDNYQRMKKDQRLALKINGEAVVELDINASYLRILHGLLGFSLPKTKDIYAVEGVSRAIVKAWISSTLGHTDFHRAWPSRSIQEFKKADIVRSKKFTYPVVKSMVLPHFPVLKDWPDCGIRWSHLMYEEAEAMMSTMESLRSMGVVALPVHDSLIVPKSKGPLAARIMRNTFESRLGVDFVVSGLR